MPTEVVGVVLWGGGGDGDGVIARGGGDGEVTGVGDGEELVDVKQVK